MKDSEEVRRLKGQLAERDALLREVLVGLWPSTPIAIKINATLSASAEPSAPVAWARLVDGVQVDGIGLRVTQSGVGEYMVDPSAPADLDERAEFEVAHVELFGCLPRTDDQKPDFALSHYNRWLIWQARAALERKP